MEKSKKENDIINKSKYLKQNIFVSESESEPEYNTNISYSDKFNVNVKQNNINNILYKINNESEITLFNKKYKKEQAQKLQYTFDKIIYFCYRKNTYPFKSRTNGILTRDSGWGCMIRCGQMIMARGIYKYLKSKNYSTEIAISETIKYFLDIPYSEDNIPLIFSFILSIGLNSNDNEPTKILPPFSAHMHCLIGKFYNKYGGEWFSDVNICQNYRDINAIFNLFPELSIIHFITDFQFEEVLNECFTLLNDDNIGKNKKIFNWNNKKYLMKKYGLFFISVRLGINKVTNEYYDSLKKLFECKECIGIIGGETNLAHYFIGYNDKGNLLYLDPHITRDAICELNDNIIMNDCLLKNIHEISIDDMSTGLSIGFLFRNIDEFEDLIQFMEKYNKTDFPCFGYIKQKIEIDITKYGNLFNDEDDF